jgi:hypothetical protein
MLAPKKSGIGADVNLQPIKVTHSILITSTYSVNIRAKCSQRLFTINWGIHYASRASNSASIEGTDLSCSCIYPKRLNLQILRRSGLNKSLLN